VQRRLFMARPVLIALTLVAVALGTASAGAQHEPTHQPAAGADQGTESHGEAQHGEAAAHGKPNILSGDLGNIFFTLLIFAIVVYVLGKYAWKPVLNILQQREQTIRESLEDAKREREEAERVLEKYTRQIEQARSEASKIVDAGRRNAEEVARRVQDQAREEAGQMVARAKREIQLATDAAVKQLYDLTAELAVDVAGRIIRKKLNPQDHKALVEESLARMRAEDAKMN
jgi:F-type H+-transporting ATPase subunit b